MRERTRSALRIPCDRARNDPPIAVHLAWYGVDGANADGRPACRIRSTETADCRPRAESDWTREATRYFPEGEHGFETVAGGNNRATVPT